MLFHGTRQIPDILLSGDIKFACVILGFSMMLWSMFGMIHTPDIEWFAKGFAFEMAPWVWGLNHFFAGFMFIHCAVREFPPMRCLMFGSYCVMCWTWIAIGRPAASFSSGMTLNFVIIFMGAILIQRSGRR